jgi:ABC-type lipoprotein release transport system permease subunit
MVGAAVAISFSLSSGFDRSAARARLPDVLASFDSLNQTQVAAAVGRLANVRSYSFRLQQSGEHLFAGSFYDAHTTIVGVGPGVRGYAVLAGRDLRGGSEVVVEAGLARVWRLALGSSLVIRDVGGRSERFRIVGTAVSPETVAFPLASGPRIYLSLREAAELMQAPRGLVNGVALWLNDPQRLDVTLSQARAAAFGVRGLQFITQNGLRLLIGQAAGIVIAVLVAFSLIALLVAGTMLAASAAAEAQRRLEAVGLLRAVGASRQAIVAASAIEAAALAIPAGAIGIVAGWLAVRGPTDGLLASLNEIGPGWSVAPLLVGALVALVALVVAASAWPAWRAACRPPLDTLRGADVVGRTRRLPLPGGIGALGLRLVLARPVRSAATALVIGLAVGVVLVILTIASVLQGLNSQPQAIGKRYQLLVQAPASAATRIARLPGVAAAAARYEVAAADSFSLGEPFALIAFAGDHTRFEDPPLIEGRRLQSVGEAEVGLGLAQALGIHPGSVLAAQLPSGPEVRFRVVGIVQALQAQGRVAYVMPARLLEASPNLSAQIAVRLRPGASAVPVERALARRGQPASSAGGIAGQSVQSWAARSSGFLAVLVALLRSVAVLDAVVCLYAVAQALGLTAQERRRALSIVRATGAGRWQIGAIFATGSLAIVTAALLLGLVAERGLIGPGVARVAASYVALSLGADATTTAYTAIGLLVGALAVAAWTAESVTRGSVVGGLRED